ncbi:hypothetical protein KI387_002824 [Taxus chinensis]|uniref:methylated diphthine methylhydrolase n=1 Tax=Taxus chinensis TaxID=29808 RepID=A0AA38GY16_TAXCH|nr:hypothetical protein KI387_002824 [Taxus chinensis]
MDVKQIHLDGNADAVEFCPDYPFQHILAAATYTLQESVQRRVGSISLFSIQDNIHLKLLHRIKTSGVFDIKWRPGNGDRQPNLLQADSDGNMAMYSLEHPEIVSEDEVQTYEEVKIKELVRENISCSSMCLTVDWDQANASPSSNIAVGLSDGLVSVVRLREAQMQIEHTWQAHGFEVWSVAYDSSHPDVLYSGADDCNFCGWDLRESSHQPIFKNTKSHQMGVCSILKSPQWENSIITGSYDECLRLWDLRLMDRPVMQESVGLGGGVWKLKFHPSIGNLVLAACMHNGFAIVRLDNDGMKIVEEYKGHDSLAYGADWFKGDTSKIDRCGICVPEVSCTTDRLDQEEHLQHDRDMRCSSITFGQCDDGSIAMNKCIVGENSNGPLNVESAHQRTICSLVATCSFYDKALHVWKSKILIPDTYSRSVDTI